MSLQQRRTQKKAYCSLARQFHPDKNQHQKCTDVMKIINEAKEELEKALRNNYSIREEERVCMDVMSEKEHISMAQNTIIISSDSSYSYDSLETSSDDSYDSGRRQIPTKPVISYNKSSTFPAKHNSNNE